MFAVIYIPNFSLQAVLRHEPELIPRAVALMDPALAKLGIIELTCSARTAGACEGMTASQAMARCSDLVIKTRSPAQEESATETLIQTAQVFSPFIESTAPGVCTMELRGLRIQTDEASARQWAGEIRGALARFDLDSRIGFAATPDLALLAARAARPVLVASNPTDFISALPIEALGLPAEFFEILNRWGIGTTGALLELGKEQLVERLGPEALEVFDRLSPDSVRPLKLAMPPETFAEQREFENEIETFEPLLFVLRRFTEQLSRRIELLYLVVAELHLKLGLSSGASHESVFKIPSPTGKAEILFRMLHTHLETVRTDAPITSLWLAAKPGRPESHQFGLFETTLRNPNQFAETLARLEALCGPSRTGTPVLEPTQRPDSFRMKPAEFCRTAEWQKPRGLQLRRSGRGSRKDGLLSPALSSKGGEGEATATLLAHSEVLRAEDGSRSVRFRRCGLQLRRFRPALSARIEFRERCPVLIRSSVFSGAIADQRGPFFSSGNWWDQSRWSREEWDVQTADGTMYRIFRMTEVCFVEGVYD